MCTFLTEHQFKATSPAPENERTMYFYDEARVDGLVKRVETPIEMSEHYKNRDDFLFYKHVDFGKKPKRFGPQDGSTSANVRPILVSFGFHIGTCVVFPEYIIIYTDAADLRNIARTPRQNIIFTFSKRAFNESLVMLHIKLKGKK